MQAILAIPVDFHYNNNMGATGFDGNIEAWAACRVPPTRNQVDKHTRQQLRVRLSRLIAANALPGFGLRSLEQGVIIADFFPLSFPRGRAET